MVEQRFETRRTFIEGHGHLVEQVPLGSTVKDGQSQVAMPPEQPPVKIVITASDVSLDLARQVCESAGLVVVPQNFLNPEQLQELKLTPLQIDGHETANGAGSGEGQQNHTHQKAHNLNAEQMVERVKLAATFEELNTLMADETRVTVIRAAEKRAEELKGQGAK